MLELSKVPVCFDPVLLKTTLAESVNHRLGIIPAFHSLQTEAGERLALERKSRCLLGQLHSQPFFFDVPAC